MLQDILFGRCVRCNSQGAMIELAGQYHTMLCMDCRNKFHSDCAVTKEYKSLCGARDKVAALELLLGSGKDVMHDYLEAEKGVLEAQMAMWKVSEKWVTGPKTVEELKKIEASKLGPRGS